MSDLLVRNVESKVMAQLKARAKMHGRSLQAEAKAILEAEAALSDRAAWLAWLEAFQAKVENPGGPDAVELLRESRNER